jgi:hypothetical protein
MLTEVNRGVGREKRKIVQIGIRRNNYFEKILARWNRWHYSAAVFHISRGWFIEGGCFGLNWPTPAATTSSNFRTDKQPQRAGRDLVLMRPLSSGYLCRGHAFKPKGRTP